MDGSPDRAAYGSLRCGAAWQRIDVGERGHVFDGDFDAEVETLGRAGVDDGDRTVGNVVSRDVVVGGGGRRLGGFDGAQNLARVRRQQQVERFWRGDENVGGFALEADPLGGGRVAGADHDG